MQGRPNKDRVLSMLGLATRSRNVVSGGFATEEAVKNGKAYLVIIAENASDNTRKNIVICVNSIRCHTGITVRRRYWGTRSARKSVPVLL